MLRLGRTESIAQDQFWKYDKNIQDKIEFKIFVLAVNSIIMNHIENISRKCCLIISIIQSEIILVSIEVIIKELLFDTHRYSWLALKIFVPNNLRFSNKSYISIFTIGHFEVLRLYSSECQWVQYQFWNFTNFKFSRFEMRC